jgi:predicted nucleotidyltransferase
VRALRAEGYDVVTVSECASRSDDRRLIEQAHQGQRILLTEDSDFSWLVFVSHADSAGVIFMRFPGHAGSALAESASSLVRDQGNQLPGAFVVIQPGYIRVSRQPGSHGELKIIRARWRVPGAFCGRRLPELQQAYGVQALWLFGSHVRGVARKQSDLDLLVQFDDRSTLSLLEFIALENRLSDWLGVQVDLVEKNGLKPAIGRYVLQEAVPV